MSRAPKRRVNCWAQLLGSLVACIGCNWCDRPDHAGDRTTVDPSAADPISSGANERTTRTEAEHGAGTTIVYNDIVKGGDRALPWEAREQYEQGLRSALQKGLGEGLEDATMARATSLGELERLVTEAPGEHVIYYGHMVGPLDARRVSPTGRLQYGATAQRFAGWLSENVGVVEVIGCKSESFALALAAERPNLTIRTFPSTMNLFEWMDPSDPRDVRVWQSESDDWTGFAPAETTLMILVTYPSPVR
jgi:hypothetical protein